MENDYREFNAIEIDIFNKIDEANETNDYKFQADILCELTSRGMIDDFDIIRTVSMISSIVCDQEEDVEYGLDGLPVENCVVMDFSDELQDLYYDGVSNEDIMKVIKNELEARERYELLKEILSNEEDS
jgi:hypothetical protein